MKAPPEWTTPVSQSYVYMLYTLNISISISRDKPTVIDLVLYFLMAESAFMSALKPDLPR